MRGRVVVGRMVFEREVICGEDSSYRKERSKGKQVHGVYRIVPAWATGVHGSKVFKNTSLWGHSLCCLRPRMGTGSLSAENTVCPQFLHQHLEDAITHCAKHVIPFFLAKRPSSVHAMMLQSYCLLPTSLFVQGYVCNPITVNEREAINSQNCVCCF